MPELTKTDAKEIIRNYFLTHFEKVNAELFISFVEKLPITGLVIFAYNQGVRDESREHLVTFYHSQDIPEKALPTARDLHGLVPDL